MIWGVLIAVSVGSSLKIFNPDQNSLGAPTSCTCPSAPFCVLILADVECYCVPCLVPVLFLLLIYLLLSFLFFYYVLLASIVFDKAFSDSVVAYITPCAHFRIHLSHFIPTTAL